MTHRLGLALFVVLSLALMETPSRAQPVRLCASSETCTRLMADLGNIESAIRQILTSDPEAIIKLQDLQKKINADITQLDSTNGERGDVYERLMSLAQQRETEIRAFQNAQLEKLYQKREQLPQAQERDTNDKQLVTQAHARLATIRRWTTQSKSNDGAIFVFRDHVLGDSTEQVLAIEKSNTGNPVVLRCSINAEGDGSCSNEGFTDCDFRRANGLNRDGTCLSEKFTYFFRNNRLISFQYVFPFEQAERNITLLKERYDNPSSVDEGETQNRLGAKFEDVTATWNTPWGDLVFSERYKRIDQSAIEFNMGAVEAQKPKPF